MLWLMSLQKEKINNPLRQVLGGVKGSVGEEKNFPQEKFFPTLDSGEVLRHPQGQGGRLCPSPSSPFGAEGEKRGGFSLFR